MKIGIRKLINTINKSTDNISIPDAIEKSFIKKVKKYPNHRHVYQNALLWIDLQGKETQIVTCKKCTKYKEV